MAFVQRVLMAVSALGADADQLLADLGIDRQVLNDPDARLPDTQVHALWEEAARRTAEEAFGLRLVELSRAYPPNHALGYAVLSSRSLEEAYARVARYVHLVHDSVTVHPLREGDLARLRVSAPRTTSRQGLEYALGLLHEGGRRGLGRDFPLREVRFRHGPPSALTVHERLFAAPVRFHQPESELVFDGALLDQPLRDADPALNAILVHMLEGQVKRRPLPGAFGERVRQLVVPALRDGAPTSALIARRLQCSPRTLHRRLMAEGLTFNALLDSIRYEAAVHHLQEGRMEIEAIAFLLGYSEVSPFYRAFRRWAGCTPAEYRRSRAARRERDSSA